MLSCGSGPTTENIFFIRYDTEISVSHMHQANSDGIAFVDHTPNKNTSYIPADATGGSNGSVELGSAVAAPLLADDEVPTGFFGRVAYHFNALKQYKEERFKTMKPWGEFFDRTKFSAPGKMEAFSRANKNVSYFYSNYVVVATISSLYVLVINPSFLISMFVSMALYYLLRIKAASNEPIVLLGREISLTQAWTFLVLFTVLSFYVTGGSSTIFWLVLSSLGTVLGHAMFREPPADMSSPLGFASYV